MPIQGLHLLLSYKCNARCSHCFLAAGPQHSATISTDLALNLVREAGDMDNIDHLFIEGGEPFLFQSLMREITACAAENGLWVGALSNGFWAHSYAAAKKTLEPLVEAGLRSLSISTDAWHEEFVPRKRALAAATVARELGLDSDIMTCGPMIPNKANDKVEVDSEIPVERGIPVFTGSVICRGRAADALCGGGDRNWESLTECTEKLAAPGRVHVGPDGEIHLCQGLLMGQNAGSRPLRELLASYKPELHPLVARLAAGGPSELARFAQDMGLWKPSGFYYDPCHLCYEVRIHLRAKFPALIGPAEIFSGVKIQVAAGMSASTLATRASKTSRS